MRRRILMAALWLAGTLGATGVVFTAVGKLSTNLSSIGDNESSARLGPGNSEPTTTIEPFITTTSPSTVLETTTVATVAETTTSSEVEPPIEDTTASPGTQPPTATPTAVRTTVVASPAVPVVTAAPPPPTVAPPTAAPSTTAVVATTDATTSTNPGPSCVTNRRALTGRNTVVYQVCPAGISLVQALPAPGWSAVAPIVVGPPTVTVTFTNSSSSTATCTLRPLGDGLVDTSNC